MKNLAGKVVLVTGGASGIGEAIVKRFAEEGAKVCVADITDNAGIKVAEVVNGHYVHTDVSVPEAVEAAVAYAVEVGGRLDVIVNCAAIQPELKTIHESTAKYSDQVFDVNLKGVMYGMKYALVQFLEQGDGGNIINISSLAGLAALEGTGAYAAAKAGVGNLTQLAAVEYGKHGIRANAVAPTAVMTRLTQAYIDNSDDPVTTRKAIESYNPLIGMAQPEDIAAVVAFLASDDARFVSGVVLPVDGAYTAK